MNSIESMLWWLDFQLTAKGFTYSIERRPGRWQADAYVYVELDLHGEGVTLEHALTELMKSIDKAKAARPQVFEGHA